MFRQFSPRNSLEMIRSTLNGEVQVGLAYVGLNKSVAAVLEHLAFARLRATFLCLPINS